MILEVLLTGGAAAAAAAAEPPGPRVDGSRGPEKPADLSPQWPRHITLSGARARLYQRRSLQVNNHFSWRDLNGNFRNFWSKNISILIGALKCETTEKFLYRIFFGIFCRESAQNGLKFFEISSFRQRLKVDTNF